MSSRSFAQDAAAKGKFVTFPSRRSVVHSTQGIVSCSQPLAARAGIKVLQEGGNAADAAVAVAAGLNLTEPCSTGIGGDMFCLFYNAKTKKTHALNGSGRSGSKCTLEQYRKDFGLPQSGPGGMPPLSAHTVTIPGAPAGWVDTVEKFGSGKLSLEQILSPVIELAEYGFPVSEISSIMWTNSESLIKKASPNYAEILKPDTNASKGYRAPQSGEIFRNPNLANTFRLLAKHGKKGFYEGAVAEALVTVVQDLGGHLTLEDLKNHAELGTEEVDAISLTFGGQGLAEPIQLWEHPPNGQGLIALLALGIMQELEKSGKISKFTEKDHNSPDYLHTIIECLRLAFSDGTRYIADPNVSPVPISQLLSESYLSQRGSEFTMDKAIPMIKAGNPSISSSDTVYFSVADPEGNAISFINSNYMGVGTGIIPAGCGFTLQNRGAGFYLDPPDHPNILAPNKRPYHTIIPGMITNAKDQTLNTCFGVMGGYMQPQGHVQVLMNMLVFGMDPQRALDAPRICIVSTGPSGDSDAGEDEVYVEEGIPAETFDALKKRGHNVVMMEGFARSMFGKGQIIRKTVQEGKIVWSAGSDLRGDGHAAPL